MSHTTGHVGHWEDLETWLSIATDSLLPKAAETLKHQTQDQLDDNITSLMAQDPGHSYNLSAQKDPEAEGKSKQRIFIQ